MELTSIMDSFAAMTQAGDAQKSAPNRPLDDRLQQWIFVPAIVPLF
jgi:hypothetical protein